MNKITLTQLKEQQNISSLDEYLNMDFSHEEDKQRFETDFPKSVREIEQLPTDKIYVNTADYQGADFAFERYGSLRAWAYQALEWLNMGISIGNCDCDENATFDDWDTVNVYRLFDGFKADKIIDTINECWQIKLVELKEDIEMSGIKIYQSNTQGKNDFVKEVLTPVVQQYGYSLASYTGYDGGEEYVWLFRRSDRKIGFIDDAKEKIDVSCDSVTALLEDVLNYIKNK